MATFVDRGLVVAQRTAREVTLLLQVLHAHVGGEAVVAGEEYQRVLGRSAGFERGEHLADGRVRLHDQVRGGVVEAALAFPFRVHRQGRVRRGQRKVEEKGFGLAGCIIDESAGAFGQRRQDGLEFPIGQRRSGRAGQVVAEELGGQGHAGGADRAIVLDEAIGRPVRHVGPEVGVEAAGRRPAGDRLGEDLAPGLAMGVGRRLVGLLVITEERAVAFGDRPVPAEVPFADRRGTVAVLLRKTGHGESVRSDEWFAEDAHDAGLQAGTPVVASGEERVARRRADAGGGVSVGEAHPFGGEFVQMRRRDLATGRVVGADVAVTEVVGEDHEDVRLTRLGGVDG